MKKVTFILLLITLLAGCKSVKLDEKQETEHIFHLQRKNIDYINIKADFKVEFPDFNQSFSSDINIAGYDSLNMTIYGPFGITVGRLYADKKEFVFYNVFENSVIQGNSYAKSFEKALKINLSLPDLISVLVNEVMGNAEEYKKYEERKESVVYAKRTDYSIDFIEYSHQKNGILRYQRKDEANEKIFDVLCEDFETTKSGVFAKVINIQIPEHKGQMKISFDKIVVSPNKIEQFRFKVPGSAKIIEFAE
ncbi:MAG TPA: DUF4292 domain-containing protein [Candidatus Kapabacteria bacterium]|nr:DUF4292 domain-containing protein [Candidatus Kapabacteria bacterium]HPU24294.1 DUF4292 domain-containing protein [Candidatus Kapabacteria bacterium]